jgi:hypothetical protein
MVMTATACDFNPTAVTDDATPPIDAIDAPDGPPIDAPDAAGPVPITFVQGAVDLRSGSQSTISVPFASDQTAGNLNVVVISCACSNLSFAAVTDSRLNNYVVATGVTTVSDNLTFSQQIFFAQNLTATADPNTITVATVAPVNSPKLRIFEYAGLAKTNALDGAANGSGSSTGLDSGSVTTSNAHDLLFAANVVSFVTTAGSPGFTQRQLDDGDLVQDREVTTAGPFKATAAQSQSGAWIMQLVAFKGEN